MYFLGIAQAYNIVAEVKFVALSHTFNPLNPFFVFMVTTTHHIKSLSCLCKDTLYQMHAL